jgi:hypothetical protein
MWQIFTQNSEGLAIQSTIGRLQEALAPEINFNQYIGEVLYRLQKEHIPFDDLFFPFYSNGKVFNTKVKYAS